MNELRKRIAASAVEAITKAGPGTAARRYLFAPDFPGFAGHFPGDPVLPAIVQLLTVVSLAGEHARAPLRLATVRSARFLSPIRPNEEILVRYVVRTDEGNRLYDGTLSVAGKPAATFLLHLVDAEENA